jgi:hypothetical protein
MGKRNNLLRVVLVFVVALAIYSFERVESRAASMALPTPAHAQPLASNGAEPQQQYPVVDAIANKIIQKYQNSTCEQLWQEKAAAKNKPKSPEEQRAIGMLHNDPQLRQVFIDKIAAPVANKMFECGMIP